MEQAAGLELDAEAPEKDNFVGGFDGLFKCTENCQLSILERSGVTANCRANLQH